MAGKITYRLAWPAFWFYYRRNERTRLLLVCGHEVLVLKQWISDGSWSLPGGGLHKNEKPVDGLLREAREETGLQFQPKDLQFLGKGAYRKAGLSFAYSVFFTRLNDKPKLHRQKHEVAELRWLNTDRLEQENLSPTLTYSLRLAADRGLLLQ